LTPAESAALTATYHRLTRNDARLTASEYFQLLAYRGDVSFRPLDPTNRPAPFKRYRAVHGVELPRGLAGGASDAIAALAGGVSEAAGLDLAGLARLLHLAAGVTRSAVRPSQRRTYFRAAMSAGNLHPLEVYVVTGTLDGLGAGVYHFAPFEVRLDRLRASDERGFLARACAAAADDRLPAAFVVVTGIPWRTAWKYGERGWRHLYWDAGTLVANFVAAADGVRLRTRVLSEFVDDAVAWLVGVDGVSEFPLVVVEVGAAAADETVGDPPAPAPIELATEPVSPIPLALSLIHEIQRAGRRDSPLAVSDRRVSGNTRVGAVGLNGAATASGRSIDEVILRRGATRLMRLEPASRRLLDLGMTVASRAAADDRTGAEATVLRHYVTVHAVSGLRAGAYVWSERGLELVHAGDYRDRSRRLCRDQPLGGDSCFTVFHTTRLETLLDTYGARSYRLANFSAGVAAGRLALLAVALGYGATALTFRDDDVADLFGADVACLLVTAVGVPAYASRRGGGPGEITELAHYDALMQRHAARLRDGV
jgi:SagB-type dehydrogenase family enzyme